MLRLFLNLLVVGYFGLFLLATGGLWWTWETFQKPPAQPIAFPHTVHAGRLALPCTYCHSHAESSRQAGVPTLDLCLSCHRSVAVDRPEIRKLAAFVERGEPLRWARVHGLPSFVYFSHKRHLRGGLDCAACHGAVEGMTVVRRVRPLELGWCVTCHRGRGAPTDCATCHQ